MREVTGEVKGGVSPVRLGPAARGQHSSDASSRVNRPLPQLAKVLWSWQPTHSSRLCRRMPTANLAAADSLTVLAARVSGGTLCRSTAADETSRRAPKAKPLQPHTSRRRCLSSTHERMLRRETRLTTAVSHSCLLTLAALLSPWRLHNHPAAFEMPICVFHGPVLLACATRTDFCVGKK